MMRLAMFLLLALAATGVAEPVGGQQECLEWGYARGVYKCLVYGEDNNAPPPPPSDPDPDGPDLVWISYPVLDESADPSCIRTAWDLVPAEDARTIQHERRNAWWESYYVLVINGYTLADCPTGETISAAGRVRAEVSDVVPAADPEIDPGFAVTGKRSYLETHGSLDYGPQTFDLDVTPPGAPPDVAVTVSVTVRSTPTTFFTVDWGDAPYDHASAPRHRTTGAPYPDGTITHTYTDVGSYDVTVWQHWELEYAVDGGPWQRLVLEPIPYTIPDFEVRQVQAVIVR